MRNERTVSVDLDYAVRMVATGCATPDQAARMCGVPLATLRAHRGMALYGRTAKGVVAAADKASRIRGTLQGVFNCVDGKASAAEIASRLKMNPAYIQQALEALQQDGYVEALQPNVRVVQWNLDAAHEEADLDFTTPGALGEASADQHAHAVRVVPSTVARAAPVQKHVESTPHKRAASAPQFRTVKPTIARDEGRSRDNARAQLLEAEQRLNAATQAKAEAERAREEALQLLEETVEALRESRKRETEEKERHAITLSELTTQRDAAQRDLDEARSAVARRGPISAEVEAAIARERDARQAAEVAAEAERVAHADTMRALEKVRAEAQSGIARAERTLRADRESLQNTIRGLQDALAEAEAERLSALGRVSDLQNALEKAEARAKECAERIRHAEQQLASERQSRLDAESAFAAERRSRDAAAQEASAVRGALESELTQARSERERAIEAAYRHAERYAHIELEVAEQRRACEQAEAKARAEQQSREEAAQALLEVKRAVALWTRP